MVASRAGLTLIPAMARNSALVQREDICVRPFEPLGKVMPSRGIGLVWRQTYQRQAILSKMTAVFSDRL